MASATKLTLNYILLVLFICVGCNLDNNKKLPSAIQGIENVNVYSSDEESEYSITFVEEQTFGDTQKVFFKQISLFAIDEVGRVYIPQDSIHVFNPDGLYLGSIGSSGKGPGEFQTIAGLGAGKELLYVFDAAFQRLSEFSINTYSNAETGWKGTSAPVRHIIT